VLFLDVVRSNFTCEKTMSDNTCSICLEPLLNASAIGTATPCGHCFHAVGLKYNFTGWLFAGHCCCCCCWSLAKRPLTIPTSFLKFERRIASGDGNYPDTRTMSSVPIATVRPNTLSKFSLVVDPRKKRTMMISV
jgi:hypothetical protein